MANNEVFIESISQETFKQNQEFLKDLDAMIKKVTVLNTDMKKAKWPSQNKKVIEEANNEIKKSSKFTLDSEKAQKQLANAYQNLRIAKNDDNRATQRARVETNALNRVKRQEETANSRLVGAYTRLRAQRDVAARQIRDLIAAGNANKRQLQQLRREYDRLNRRVVLADRAIGNFRDNVGNYGSAFRGVRNLIGAFGVVSGTLIAADLTRSAFRIARNMQSLNFALGAVIESEEELAETQTFLSDLGNRYGAEIETLTRSYIKFYAASRQSNLGLDETRRIFEVAAKAAGVLGLRQDELNGIYLAFEQMLSKGKVSTEELRRQLGERLPGAFTLMAEALGVTTAELDEMLRKGEVMSADALPKLADQIEKTFGLDKIEKVENLNAATTRLSNAWAETVANITDSEGPISKALIGILNTITSIVEGIKLWNMSYNELRANIEQGVSSSSYKIQLDFYKAIGDEAENAAKLDKERSEEAIRNTKERLARLREEESALKKAGKGEKEWYGIVVNNGTKAYRENKRAQEELNNELARHEGVLKAANDQLGLNTEATKKNKDEKDKTKIILQGTIAWYERLIKSLEDERSRLAQNSREYETYTTLIEDAQKELNKFRIEIDGVNAGLEKGAVGIKAYRDALESMEDSLKGGEIEGIETGGIDDLERQVEVAKDGEAAVKRLRQETDRFIESFQTDFFQEGGLASLQMFFDGTFDKMLAGAEGFGEKFAVVFDSIAEVGQEAFNLIAQASNQQFEVAIANAQKERDIALQFAGDSATAREAIETEYDEKVRQIRAEQAKSQKAQAIFNSIINTAQAVVAALAVGPPQGIVLASIVGAIGAAQTALIASTPVPQFKDGVRDFEGGYAMVNDRKGSQYREVVTTPDGQVMRPVGRNVFMDLPKGSNVYSSETEFQKELNGLLVDNQINPLGVGPRMPEIIIANSSDIDYDRIADIMQSTVGGIKSYHTDINKRGITTYTQTAHGKNVRMNNRTIMK